MAEMKQRYKCLICGRDKFQRRNEPHWCNGNYRKHRQRFQAIPYIPEPATCDHLWKIYSTEDADRVLIKCRVCGEPYYDTPPADLKPAEPEMPLEVPEKIEWLEYEAWKCPYCHKKALVNFDAHDQQVRQAAVKEFAEEVCAYLKDALRIVSLTTEETVHTHIRAMAEEK
jgi:DNA-directed RNA polymerase subunit RPC12/RpoP